MRTLARWVARLYPEAWRLRYGVELEALLEDVGPGAGDLWDLARGALFMQMTNVSFWKIVAGCAVAGTLAAGIVASTLPDRYVSTAVIRIRRSSARRADSAHAFTTVCPQPDLANLDHHVDLETGPLAFRDIARIRRRRRSGPLRRDQSTEPRGQPAVRQRRGSHRSARPRIAARAARQSKSRESHDQRPFDGDAGRFAVRGDLVDRATNGAGASYESAASRPRAWLSASPSPS